MNDIKKLMGKMRRKRASLLARAAQLGHSRKCAVCSDKFFPTSPNQKFCTAECRQEAKKRRLRRSKEPSGSSLLPHRIKGTVEFQEYHAKRMHKYYLRRKLRADGQTASRES